jgi:Raf kinase inhibitor-like YbhB/YbcL family protein
MAGTLNITIDAWADGGTIPDKYSFCIPADEGHVTGGPNISPAISWTGAPDGTQSYAVICVDPDVPSVLDDFNQEGRTVSKDLPRVDLYHWILVDIPGSIASLAEGAESEGVVAKGKSTGAVDHGVRGANGYGAFMAGDPDMAGDYGGYDGPCPPWNDEIPHRYVFTVYALDVASLGLGGVFDGAAAMAAIEGHVLAEGTCIGMYSLNPDVRAGM